MAASSGESIGKLFIELGLQDQALAPAINKAIAEADRLKTGVDKAGRTAAKAMAPLASAFNNVSDAERKWIAQTIAANAGEKARPPTLSVTIPPPSSP